jgi:hypothetical protein
VPHRSPSLAPPDTHRRLKLNLRCVSGGATERIGRGLGRTGQSKVNGSDGIEREGALMHKGVVPCCPRITTVVLPERYRSTTVRLCWLHLCAGKVSIFWSGSIQRIRHRLVGTHSTASLINGLGDRWGRSGMRPYRVYLANAPAGARGSVGNRIRRKGARCVSFAQPARDSHPGDTPAPPKRLKTGQIPHGTGCADLPSRARLAMRVTREA